jgi:hypothetical protein
MRNIKAFGLLAGFLVLSLTLASTAFAQTAQPQPGLRVTWNLPSPPTEGRVGLRLTLSNLELQNSGSQPWLRAGNNKLQLAYRWFNAANQPLDPKNRDNGYDELRADLPQDIPPGGRLLFPQFVVGVPNAPGDYTLRVDLLQGERTYVSTLGGQDLSLKIKVTGRDQAPPTTAMELLPIYTTNSLFNVTWSGKDEDNGSGLVNYDIQYRAATETDWRDWLVNTTLTSARFQGKNGELYLFRTRARDAAGNVGKYPDNEQASTRVDTLPPAAKVENLSPQSAGTFLVRWSAFDNVSEGAVSLIDLQYREGADGQWTDWLSGNSVGWALFRGAEGKTYQFRARATDYAGNRGEFTSDPQASTVVTAALTPLVAPVVASPVVTASTAPTATAPTSFNLFFPYVAKSGDNGTGTSGVQIYNPGSTPVDVFISFNDRAGAPITQVVNNITQTVSPDAAAGLARVDTILRSVEPGKTLNVWAGSLAAASFNGWVQVRSASKVEASLIRQPSSGLPVQTPGTEAANTLHLPYIKKADAQNSSFINLANTSPNPADVTITYYDGASGNVLATDRRTLPRFGSVRFGASSIPTGDPNARFTGSAVISANVALAATVETPLEDGTPVGYAGVSQSQAGQNLATLPVYRDVSGVTTALLVQNTGKDAVTVKLEYLDDKDAVVATKEQNLAGYGRLVAWQGDVKELNAGFAGKVRVTTAAPSGRLVATVLGAGPNFRSKNFL